MCLVATFRVVMAFRRCGEGSERWTGARRGGDWSLLALRAGRKVVFLTVSSSHSCTCPFRSLAMDMPAPTSAVLQIPSVLATRSWWRSCRSSQAIDEDHHEVVCSSGGDFPRPQSPHHRWWTLIFWSRLGPMHATTCPTVNTISRCGSRSTGDLVGTSRGVRRTPRSSRPLEGSCTVRARRVPQTGRPERHPLPRPHHVSIEGCSLGTF